jgi:AraC-like DNA-binding protein
MHFQIVQPNGLLRYYVKHYCFMESEVHEGIVTERVIPTEGVQLMFHYKNPFVVNRPNHTAYRQPRSILSGLSHSYSDVSTHGEAGVAFIQFYPAGACHFFGFPLSDIENQSIDLSDVFSHKVCEIEEQLYFKQSICEKVTVIEHFLLSQFSPIPQFDYQLLQSSIQLIKKNKGQISASLLSDKLATTPKSLERKFSTYMGKTPKQFIKLIRYQEILVNFSNHKSIPLTKHAYLNGYFDQSHFIHDFKSYTGYTPKEFISKYPDFDLNADTC